jgi:ABC-type branched-subunit amino acid transport system ATPase component
MSNSETARFIQLIREVTEGKTLLTVEHDMGVVFGLADKIAVVVYGEVIAFDTPAVRANAACRRPIWALPWQTNRQERIEMLKINDLHAYYGKSHVLHGVDFEVQPGEIVALLGRNGSGRSTTAKAIMGWCTGRARWTGRARTCGQKSLRDRPPGPGLCAREPRRVSQPDGAPEPAAGPERQGQGQPLGL